MPKWANVAGAGWFWGSVSICSSVLLSIVTYREGRFNELPSLRAGLSLLLLMLICLIAVLALLIKAAFKRQPCIALLGWLVVCIAAPFLMRINPLNERAGFKQYARTVLTREEWENTAQFAQANFTNKYRYLCGPEKGLWESKADEELWKKMAASTPVTKLKGYVCIQARDGYTTFSWGGALVGHRCIYIYNATDTRARLSFRSSTNAEELLSLGTEAVIFENAAPGIDVAWEP